MWRRLSGQDSMLNSLPFMSEEVRFNLVHKIRESCDATIYTNNNHNVIIAQSSPQHPAWIWTIDGINNKSIQELSTHFIRLYKSIEKLTFVAKPEIAQKLAKEYADYRHISYICEMEMESYHCPHINHPKSIKGCLDHANENDLSTIARFFVGFIQDGFDKTITEERGLSIAQRYLKSDNFYVWRDQHEIVSMAHIAHRAPRHARINEVYTKPEKRRQGYAGMIVAAISQIIMQEELTPVLYTDLSNPFSNKAYKNVGFIECGKVSQISFNI